MDTNKATININSLIKKFEKIYKGLNKEQLTELDKELSKIYPSEQSEVLIAADYDNDENSMGLDIFISQPLSTTTVKNINFDKLMQEYLIRADINKLTNVVKCLELMENKGKNNYEIDFIPVFYNDDLKNYYFHSRITKLH